MSKGQRVKGHSAPHVTRQFIANRESYPAQIQIQADDSSRQKVADSPLYATFDYLSYREPIGYTGVALYFLLTFTPPHQALHNFYSIDGSAKCEVTPRYTFAESRILCRTPCFFSFVSGTLAALQQQNTS